jgi:hypothetical protein
MKATLILERRTKSGLVLEHREQPSRSFTKKLIDLLYVQFAQIASGAPYTGSVDTDGNLLPLDIDGAIQQGAIASPGGGAGLWLQNVFSKSQVVSDILGIVIGAGVVAAAPLDYRLGQRFGHGSYPPDGGAILQDSYNAGDDNQDTFSGNAWRAQAFNPIRTYRSTSVQVMLWRSGACGDVTVRLRGISVRPADYTQDLQPGTNDLATATIAEAAIPLASPGAFLTATWAAPVDIYSGRVYAIVLSCPGAANCNWRRDGTNPTFYRVFPMHGRGGAWNSVDAGATWGGISDGNTYMFESYGQSIGEFEHGGTILKDLTFAHPNGQLTIERLFTNNTGGALTVQECGIDARAHTYYGGAMRKIDTMLICHDVGGVGLPIVVNDTEVLAVQYQMQTTV